LKSRDAPASSAASAAFCNSLRTTLTRATLMANAANTNRGIRKATKNSTTDPRCCRREADARRSKCVRDVRAGMMLSLIVHHGDRADRDGTRDCAEDRTEHEPLVRVADRYRQRRALR